MKRVGIFLGVEPHAGGMFQYAQSLLEALHALRRYYEVEIACASRAWAPVLAPYGFRVTWLNHAACGMRWAFLTMILRVPGPLAAWLNPLAWQMRRLCCHAWIFPAQDILAYQAGLKAVVSVHDLMHRYESNFPEVAGWWRFHWREYRFRHLAKSAAGILVDSEVGKRHVVEAYAVNPDKVYSLPYVPPRSVFMPEPADFDARYALPPKFFFYPAQFWEHKNHKRLIDAAAMLRRELPDLRLVFTGGRRYAYESVRAHAESQGMLGHITFAGYVPDADLSGFYRRARALVMPTFFGPTNIPPLEAMACGCPMAVSGIYAMPEQLGEAALYFDPRSAQSMADVMRRLWQDDALCQNLADKGKMRLAQNGQDQFNERLRYVVDMVCV